MQSVICVIFASDCMHNFFLCFSEIISGCCLSLADKLCLAASLTMDERFAFHEPLLIKLHVIAANALIFCPQAENWTPGVGLAAVHCCIVRHKAERALHVGSM